MEIVIQKFIEDSDFRNKIFSNLAKLIFISLNCILLLAKICPNYNSNIVLGDIYTLYDKIPLIYYVLYLLIFLGFCFILYKMTNIFEHILASILYIFYNKIFLKIYTHLFTNINQGESDLIENIFLFVFKIKGISIKNLYIDKSDFYKFIQEHQKSVPKLVENNISQIVVLIHISIFYFYFFRNFINFDNFFYPIIFMIFILRFILGSLFYYWFLDKDAFNYDFYERLRLKLIILSIPSFDDKIE